MDLISGTAPNARHTCDSDIHREGEGERGRERERERERAIVGTLLCLLSLSLSLSATINTPEAAGPPGELTTTKLSPTAPFLAQILLGRPVRVRTLERAWNDITPHRPRLRRFHEFLRPICSRDCRCGAAPCPPFHHTSQGGGRVVAECDTYRSKALDNYPGTNYLAAVAPSESEKVFPQDGWISVHSRKETPGAAKPHSQLACSSLDPNNGCARR